MADITIDALIDSNKRLDKQLPSSDNYSEGSQIIDLKDSTLYILTDGVWIKQQTIKPGERYVVKSLDNAIYQVDNDFKLQRIFTEDIINNGNKETTIVKVFLNEYAPRTSKIFEENDVTFSSMEIMLPVILDNWDGVFKNIKFGSQAGQKELQDWLENNGFLENNSTTNKEVTTEDLRNFAVLLCSLLRETNDNSVGYEKLLQKLLNTTYDINEKSYSFKYILDSLRNHSYIYPSDKDIILRNIVNKEFLLDSFSFISDPRSSGESRDIGFNVYIRKQLSKTWYNLINKSNLMDEISNNEYIKNNFKSDIVNMNRNDIDCWEFYDSLVEISKSLDSSDKLYQSIKTIIDTCNPKSLIFLVERLMEQSQNIEIKNLRKNITLEDSDDINKLNTTLESLAISNEKLSVLKRFKSLVDKYFFTKYDKRTDFIKNPNQYKNRKDVLIEDTELINPKTLSTVDTDAFKVLIDDETLGVNIKLIEDKINALASDKSKLNSFAENLKNPYVIQDLTKYYTGEYIKAALKEKGVEIPEGVFDIAQQTDVEERIDPLTGEPYKEFFKKDPRIQLSIDLKNITDLIKSTKSTIEYARTLADEISEQKYNKPVDDRLYNAENDEGKPIKVKQVQARDILVNIDFMLSALATYINDYKENNLSNVNFNDIVNDMQNNPSINKLFSATYSKLINLIKTDLDPKVKELLLLFKKYEGIVDSLKLTDLSQQTDKMNLKKIPPVLVQEAQHKAKTLVTHIEDYVLTLKAENDRKPRFITKPKTKDDSMYELRGYNKFLRLLKTAAAYKFTSNDLEDFLKNILIKNDALMANKNLMSQELSRDISLLYTSAQSIIKFLNLKQGTDINKELQIFITKSSEYGSVYPKDINIDFIKVNLHEIVNIISDILNNKSTQYSYDEILNAIKNKNDNLYKVRVEDVDSNELFSIFQDLKVSKFDPSLINNIVSTAQSKGISTSADYIISYVANKLFYLFRQTLIHGSKENKPSLLEYLDHQKFNLTLDIADSFSNGKFSTLVSTFQLDNIDRKVFMNAEFRFNQLKNKKIYQSLKDEEIKAMANYKVFSHISFILFNTINNYDPLKELLKGCESWDFSDKLINNVLPQCKVYNIKGDIINTQNNTNILDEVKANIIKPLESSSQNSSDNVFRSLFNKVKELNRNSLKANAVLAAKLIKSVSSQKSKISSKYNSLNPKIVDKLNKINLELNSKQQLVKNKPADYDQNMQLNEKLQKEYNNLVVTQKDLKNELQELKLNKSYKQSKERMIDILDTIHKIDEKLSKNQQKLSKIPKSFYDYIKLEDDYDKLISVKDKLQTLQSDLSQQSTSIKDEIDDIYNIASEQLKTYIPDIKKYISDTVEKDPILMKYTAITTKFGNAKDKYSVINETEDSDNILPVNIKIDEQLINKDQELVLDRSFNDEKREAVNSIKYKLNTAYDVLGKLYYNSGADKLSESKVNALQKLLLKIDSLKESLMNKINSRLSESKLYSDKYVTKELVEQKIKSFKDNLYSKLATIVSKSDECYDKTEKLSILLNKINLTISEVESLIELY